MKVVCLVVIVLCGIVAAAASALTEKFAWQELEFSWPSDEAKQTAIREGSYIPSNNLPLAFDVWKDKKLFLTVPRWRTGVASTLNYIEYSSDELSPILHPYPSWEKNQLEQQTSSENPSIVSSFGIRVDECDRLWLVDSGITDLLGKPAKIQSPSVLVFNLNDNELMKRFEIPKKQMKENSFFVNIFVDVVPDRCDKTFAYILDVYGYGIIVYDFKHEKSWRVNHHFFSMDPIQGNLNVAGVNFQWHDGVFAIALGKTLNEHGDRTLYFHALASLNEFSVANTVLKNESYCTSSESYHAYSSLGKRGSNSQSSSEVFDGLTNVLFYTQINRDAIGCWNTLKPFTIENQGLVFSDSELLVFPNELRIDSEGNLLVLSNRMPVFMFSTLKPGFNYRIMTGNTSEIIKGTPCTMD